MSQKVCSRSAAWVLDFMYFDVHAHLQDPKFANINWDAYCKQFKIQSIVCNGTGVHDWSRVLELSSKFEKVIPSIGVHPWYVQNQPEDWFEQLSTLLSTKTVFMGEIGIDKWVRGVDFELQKECFIKQLDLACEVDLPVTIHCLKAFGHLLDILKGIKRLPRGFLLHSYSGPLEILDEFLELGAYFSFSAYFLNERKRNQREIFKEIPLDRILIESDAPHMPGPSDWMQQQYRNQSLNLFSDLSSTEPSIVVPVYSEVAKIYKISPSKLKDQIQRNFEHFFWNTSEDGLQ